MTRCIFAGSLLFVVTLALVFRLPDLENRPMHADEAVQARRFADLAWGPGYRYDPHEFHGPTLSYATWPVWQLRGADCFAATEPAMYRVVPLLFGVVLVLLLAILGDALGRPAAVMAGVFLAISPVFVYFSRYYIHEMLLVFFSLAAFAAGWRALRSDRWRWSLAAGLAVGLMQATKETAVLSYFAAVTATLMVLAIRARRGARPGGRLSDGLPSRWRLHALLAAGTALLTATLLLASFGANPRGPWDGVMTYFPWLARAAGDSPHIHPWYFYWQRLLWWQQDEAPRWSEAFTLALALVGVLAAVVGNRRDPSHANRTAVCWLAAYTAVLAAVYTLIPYKTPWCVLQFAIGFNLLAGVGAVAVLRVLPNTRLRWVGGALLLALTAQLAGQAWRTIHEYPADPVNPWVYAHPTPRVQQLSDILDQLAAALPETQDSRVYVIWSGPYYWPLPWYLRQWERVGYWTEMPSNARAPLVISCPRYDAELTEQLEPTHLMTGYYSLRPGELLQLWVHIEVWESHLRRLGRI